VVRFAGATAEIDFVVTEYEPGRAIAWRVEAMRTNGREVRLEYESSFRLEPEGEGTLVRTRVEVKYRRRSARLMARLVRRETAALLDRSLEGLERVAIGGAPAPHPEPAASLLADGLDFPTLSLGLTVLTGVAYVLVRTIADVFYAPLRLAPEDVGLGHAELLGRSVGLIAVALLVTVDLTILSSSLAGRRGVRWLAVLPLGVAWLLIGYYVDSAIPVIIVGLTSVVQVAISVGGMRRLILEKTTLRRWRALLLLVTTLLSLLAYSSVLAVLAVQSRRDVQRGLGLSGAASVLLPWEASTADVTWLGDTPPPEVPACGVYLGAGDTTAFVFDDINHALLRLPSDEVLIRLHTYSTGC
jgi:hypothetical protein